MNPADKDYLIVVQCDIVKQRCPGYLCEKAFTERTGGYASFPRDKDYRRIDLTCGGCCGRALHRKLTLFCRTIKKKEGLDKDRLLVILSSCMTKDNYHAPPCPHLDYIQTLIGHIGLDLWQDTVIDETSEKRRQDGIYAS